MKSKNVEDFHWTMKICWLKSIFVMQFYLLNCTCRMEWTKVIVDVRSCGPFFLRGWNFFKECPNLQCSGWDEHLMDFLWIYFEVLGEFYFLKFQNFSSKYFKFFKINKFFESDQKVTKIPNGFPTFSYFFTTQNQFHLLPYHELKNNS